MRLNLHEIPSPPPADPLEFLRAVANVNASDYTLLHSASGGTSILGFDSLITLEVDSQGTPRLCGSGTLPSVAGLPPLEALDAAVNAFNFDTPHPLLGWLGFLSYDLARHLENIPTHTPTPDDLHWPLIRFSLYKHYLLFTPEGTQAFSLSANQPEPFPSLSPQSSSLSTPVPPARLLTQQPRASFEAKVRHVKDYIAAGDIYQANLAQHWSLETPAPPHDIFTRLCHISPAPYAACLRFTSRGIPHHVLSASPELFLHLDNTTLTTRPIKGTRPRDLTNPTRDAALRDELLSSAKDHAELTMIVDLLRNDLGRVSSFGTVRVTEPRALEQHPTVWHTVATITSQLRPGTTLAELLAATCPGGSITGAPKIRAMQIIEQLEGAADHGTAPRGTAFPSGESPHATSPFPSDDSPLDTSPLPTPPIPLTAQKGSATPPPDAFRRNLYCGNIGAIAPPHGPHAKSLLLNIAIRTILLQNTTAHIYAGGGIVADSDPAKEYEETLHKSAALFRALNATPP